MYKRQVHLPVTQLISLEDTSNRGGGAIYDFKDIQAISEFARTSKLPLHLDGARLMNAMVENKVDLKVYSACFDSISLCLSKGLGAPVGSVLIGSKSFIHDARRVRKVHGGGMRQAGIIAAGGLFALKNNIDRLKDDHHRARVLEATLNSVDWVNEVMPVDTNIVVAVLKNVENRDLYIDKMAEGGVKSIAFGPGMIRFVTHLDISDSDIDRTLEIIKSIA